MKHKSKIILAAVIISLILIMTCSTVLADEIWIPETESSAELLLPGLSLLAIAAIAVGALAVVTGIVILIVMRKRK